MNGITIIILILIINNIIVAGVVVGGNSTVLSYIDHWWLAHLQPVINKEGCGPQLNEASYIDLYDGITPNPSCTPSISTVHHGGVMVSLWKRTVTMNTVHYGGEMASLWERTVTTNTAHYRGVMASL